MVARAGAGGLLRYELLGPLRVSRAGVTRSPGPAMQGAVLAVLLLHANEPVPREQIVQAVWGTRATANSGALVVTYVSRLRRVLEPERARRAAGAVLGSHGAGYRLAVGAGQLDLHEFEAARRRARDQRAAGEAAR
ncbi:AfsR/SARP family transcriptional regulator, partial [Kitasatospora sp. LaBMicrA B282]|uniref:AfsR/SARP family transcriptional regulator n=1 Tax=Kitasatospora sp. LaBMicrA B282 TaxID=3420949 RepID=UPI003D0E79D2